MSDASLRYRSREDVQLVLRDTMFIEPQHPHQLQPVAHWAAARSSHRHLAVPNVDNKDHKNGKRQLPVESAKPSYAFECRNMWMYNHEKRDQSSYVLQSAKASGGEMGRIKIINNSTLSQNMNSFGADAIGDHKLSGSSVNWEKFTTYNFENSEGYSAEWEHFPMYDINRKIGTVLAAKRRTSYHKMAVRMNQKHLPLSEPVLAPCLIEFESEEHRHRQKSSVHAIDQEMSADCMCIEEDGIRSTGLVDKEPCPDTNLTYLKHEHCKCSNLSAFMVPEMKNDSLRSFVSSWLKLKDGSNSCPGDIAQPSLDADFGRERESISGTRLISSDRSSPELSKSNKMPYSSTDNSETLKMPSAPKLANRCKGLQKFSNTDQYLKVGIDMECEDRMVRDSTVAAKGRGTAFFEMLTLPTTQHRRSPNNNEEGSGGISTQFVEKKNESSLKTDTLYIDVPETSSFPAVGTSSARSLKISRDIVCPNMNDAETPNANLTQVSSRELSLSRTESMDVDHVLFNVEKPSSQGETPLDSESSLKWVERLRRNPSDSISLGAKRFKVAHASPGGEAQNMLLTKVVNYNRSISDSPQCQPKNSECSSWDSGKVMPWIQRWSRRSHGTLSPLPVICEPENSKVQTEKFDAGKFPSIAAMALVGRTLNGFQPCEFRQRGASIVWKA